jgi:hypothetical protein
VGVVVAVPVLGRPWRVVPLIVAHLSALAETPVRLLFVASPGDDAEIEKLEQVGASYVVAPFERGPGDWARKINLVYRIFTGADDLCFCPAWADRALECAVATGAGVVGTQDNANQRVVRGDHATHNLVARWYADTMGTVDGAGAVVSEAYSHNYADDELVGTARARGLWTFCPGAEVPHLHPNYDREIRRDETYEIGQRDYQQDALLFRQRERLWRVGSRL